MLVALTALPVVYTVTAQDQSRLCLTQALVHGRVSSDACLSTSVDKSSYAGHYYSDKAPGMSVLEIPSAEALHLRPIDQVKKRDRSLWGVRVLSSGLAYLLCAFLVGRVAEALAPGRGGASLVAFALGTLAAPLAATNFDHVTAGAFAFAAFVLAWRQRFVLAGLLAGAAPCVEYQAGAVLVILAFYVGLKHRRGLPAFVAGAVPGPVLLLVYNRLAFGSPLHFPYHYIANAYSTEQAKGFFGIGAPRLYGLYEVFSGAGGLLVLSPVLVAAAWGLGLLARRHRAEVAVCAAVTLFFVILNCGYFLPYGGFSPGPRFLVPALPFLAVGLGPAFAWRPRLTALLAVLSVVPTIATTLMWDSSGRVRQTIWGELARFALNGSSSRFARKMTETVYGWIGLGKLGSAAVMALAAAAALAVGFRALPAPPIRVPVRSRSAAIAVSLALVFAADASAFAGYPYGGKPPEPGGAPLFASISASVGGRPVPSSNTFAPGDEVDFAVTLSDPTPVPAPGAALWIQLAPGMQLLGRPFFERGPGCTGTSLLSCNLDYLSAQMSTLVRLGVRIAPGASSRLKVEAWGTEQGVPGPRASITIRTVGGR